MTIHLRAVQVKKFRPWPDSFPFNVPLLAQLEEQAFTAPVTFLVGENGSGKSTLLEALACAVGSPTVGSAETRSDETLKPLREMARDLRLVWNKRTKKGFFMRSEDFFGFARRVDQARSELEADLEQVKEDYKDRSDYARGLASMAYQRELGDIEHRYGDGVDAQSHGESYIKLFQNRFIPGGLYLLDEPEAPLSPKRQLSFLVLLKQMIDENAQFIIATHSPILMGYPGATILSCDTGRLKEVAYNDLEHVYITKGFLENPRIYLRELGLL
jgi:predicted ATPase